MTASEGTDDPLAFLHGLRRYGVKTGFDRIERLLDALDRPERSFDAVQVGGTNGKGSVAQLVARGLRHDGRRVGLYTSPHLTELGERVRVDGEPMRRGAMAGFVDAVESTVRAMIAEGDAPTFFEVTTAMALWQFARRDADVAVLEVGMGGRFDTTSVCDADVAAVTSVDREHTDVLGDTVDEIAWEIGHVIPDDGVAVTGAGGDALDVLDGMAAERDAELRALDREIAVERAGSDRDEQVLDVALADRRLAGLRTPLLGAHQARNVGVAVGVLDALGVGDAAVESGVRRVAPHGRFEVVDRDPDVVLDAAHNPAAARALAATLAERFPDATIRGVVGVLADKDLEGIVDALAEPLDGVEAVAPPSPRAETPEVVAEAFTSAGVPAAIHGSVGAGVEAAVAAAEVDDLVVVTGSLYTVGEARRRWTERPRDLDPAWLDAATDDGDGGASRWVGDGESDRHGVVRADRLTDAEVERVAAAVQDTGVDARWTDGHGATFDRSVVLAGSPPAFEALAAALPHHLARRVVGETAPPTATDVMGILNVTPDSFYDGGRYVDRDDAVARAETMVDAGADVIDVGGESTRPGAEPVPVDEERERVVPVIEALADRDIDARISVDTRNPGTARAALDAGADVVNDVTGLADPAMRHLCADRDCDVVVMDALDVPVDPDAEPEYDDVVADVLDRLAESVLRARRAGVDPERITVDPGIGFGKGSDGDAALLRRTHELRSLGHPVLIGASRKSFLGALAGLEDADERLQASVGAALHAARHGADVVRVHDVAATVEALRTAEALWRRDREP